MDRIKSSLLLYFLLLGVFAYTIYPALTESNKGEYYVFASIIFIGFISYFTVFTFTK